MERGSEARMHASDEATREGLRLARKAGAAYQEMVEYFVAHVADQGAMKQVGDYRVGVAMESPEPLWHPDGDSLVLSQPPTDANVHLEVVVSDASDGRFIPQLAVVASMLDAQGRSRGAWDLPLLWHPTMFHYGRNIAVPPGSYTVHVSIARPLFFRHDAENGKRYRAPVALDFPDFSVKERSR